jgi:magnesium-transporting ATPase (P-type)
MDLSRCRLPELRPGASWNEVQDANQIETQLAALQSGLRWEISRAARWLITSILFAAGVWVVAALAKSILFLIVALLALFFIWNRWKLWRLLRNFLPAPSQNQREWIEAVLNGLEKPPLWYRLSGGIAAVIILSFFVVITIVVVSTSGMWLRLLYAFCWFVIVVVMVLRFKLKDKTR